MALCACPNTAPLVDIPQDDCPIDIKQIVRIGIQKRGFVWDTAGVTPTDISTKADWDTLIAATDDTKIVLTPLLSSPLITPGDFLTEGGGNETPLGVEEINGTNPSQFTAQMRSVKTEIEVALKDFMCRSNLVVYFISNEGYIFVKDQAVATQSTGFNIENKTFGVSDRNVQGFGTKDTHNIQFYLAAGWSENLKRITPADFDPIYDI